MTVAVLLLVAGLVLLIAGAEVFVRGATRLAVNLGIPPLLIGLTVVAYATSSPELAVSVQAACSGSSCVAVGNVVGSNIFNILLILGLSAAITPLIVSRRLVQLEVPLMLGISVLLFLMALDGKIGRFDGLLLAAGMVAYTVFIVKEALRESRQTQVPAQASKEAIGIEKRSRGTDGLARSVGLIIAGLVILVWGANWLVDGAVVLAKLLGVSESVIALTIIAAGTSLPEVATSVVAGLRCQRDIAIGNVVGSNIFNILGVLGVAALIPSGGIEVPATMLHFDFLVMVGAALACLPVVFTGYQVARWEGILFLAYYVAYVVFLVLSATGSIALPLFRTGVMGFFLPVSAITLVLLWVQAVWLQRRLAQVAQRRQEVDAMLVKAGMKDEG